MFGQLTEEESQVVCKETKFLKLIPDSENVN